MADEKARRGRPPSGWPRLELVVTLKGTPAYKAWIDSAAVAAGVPVSDWIEEAVRREAKRRKLDPPPSRTHDA